ncbi:MAG: late competence development ComFB family protein [Clostridia bacterium]|nr:late competence development ComFB family protein [Clostridia bacterium]
MELKNYMEVLVWQTLDELLKKRADICNCHKCRLDIAAKALNSLPPKYIVSYHGEVYTKVAVLQNQSNADVISAVTQAIMHVSKNPHHLID